MPKEPNGKELNGASAPDEEVEDIDATDTVVLPEQALLDSEADVADTAIRKIVAPPPPPPSPKTGANARRRVEDYLEMRRAARELRDLEDFDAD